MKTFGLLLLALVSCCIAADLPVIPETLVQPPTGPGLTITADYLEVQLKSNIVYYSNNVIATYPPAKAGDAPAILRSVELISSGGMGAKITNVIARQHVELDNGDNHARGAHAVYDSRTERIVLTGAYDAEHPLPVIYSSQGTQAASIIIYDRNLSKMFFTNVQTDISRAALDSASSTNSSRGRTNAPGKTTNAPARGLKIVP